MTVLPEIRLAPSITMNGQDKKLPFEQTGRDMVLQDAVAQLGHYNKEERIRAAKFIHQTAAIHPQQVAPFLTRLLPALDHAETQTRWMILRTLGLCASHQPETALAALPHAQHFLSTQSGATLWNATMVYLGNVGATSAENASRILPIIEQALHGLPQLTKAVLESLARLLEAADLPTMIRISEIASSYTVNNQAGVRATAKKIVKRVGDCGLILPAPVVGLRLSHRVQVQARPRQVYDAITHSDELNRWLTSQAFVDARSGGSLQLRWENWGPEKRTREDGGPILEAVRPERFVFKWHPHRPDYATLVEITLQPQEDNTLLQLSESGFEDSPAGQQSLAECSASWVEALAHLKAYVETQAD